MNWMPTMAPPASKPTTTGTSPPKPLALALMTQPAPLVAFRTLCTLVVAKSVTSSNPSASGRTAR